MKRTDVTAARPAGQRRGFMRLRPGALVGLAVSALAIEVVLILGFTLPLSIWTNPAVVPTERPLATVLGTGAGGALRFGAAVACAFAAFALALWCARRVSGRAVFALVLLTTVVFSATLAPLNPLAAHDVYHNIADARTMWIYGDNPNILPPNVYPDDPYFEHVAAWSDFASPYGPVWYFVSGAPLPFTGDGLWPNVLGQKALTSAFLLAATALVMLIAARIRPGAAAAAGVLVGWNPLLQFETAGNAHNDVVMVVFALAALYAVTRRWWVAVFPLLALSVASKYVLILLGPILLIWMLKRTDVPRRWVALSLVLGAITGVAVYVPFFAGADTLNILRRQTNFNTSSPSALFDAVLWSRFHLDTLSSARIMKLVVVPLYVVCYAALLWRIPRDAGLVALVRAGFWAVFLLLLIATWWFWPWYLLWLAPLGALLPGSRPALLAALFSATAMAMYLPYFWLLYEDGLLLQAATAGAAFLLPALAAAAPRITRRDRREPAGALAAD